MANQNTTLNPEIFRAYDIRGIVGEDITPDKTEIIGKAIGTLLLGYHNGNDIVVAMDNRVSSEELKARLIQGLRSTGCNVIDIGLTTSPMMYQAVYAGGYSGGVIVSASHNPKEYNGFKIVGKQAYPVASEEMYKLRDIAVSGAFAQGSAQDSGTLTHKDTQEDYLNKITSVIHLERPLKVVVDTGNGVAGKFAPELYRRLGCEVIEVFCELDGTFPNHLANPEHEKNLLDAMRIVKESGADAGIGIDGDGDRTGLIDENGKFLSSDYTIILLERDYLMRHPGDTILIDVKSSLNVIGDIEARGGVPFLYKTGHSLIKMKMREMNLHLGGEFSGHLYVFENYYPFDDALYASAKLLEIISKEQKPISEHFASLRQLYATDLVELGCPDAVKFDVMKRVVEYLSANYEVKNIDGSRVTFPDGWALLRASNTTPYLTFRAEATSAQGLVRVLETVNTTLQRYPEIDRGPLEAAIAKAKAAA